MMVILTGKHSGDKDLQISGMIHRVFLFDQLTFTDRYGGLEGRSLHISKPASPVRKCQ